VNAVVRILTRLFGIGAGAAEDDEADAARLKDLRKAGRTAGDIAREGEAEAKRLRDRATDPGRSK
jgi:hypothetical protein